MADSKDPYNSLPAIPDCLDGDMTAADFVTVLRDIRFRGGMHTIKLDKEALLVLFAACASPSLLAVAQYVTASTDHGDEKRRSVTASARRSGRARCRAKSFENTRPNAMVAATKMKRGRTRASHRQRRHGDRAHMITRAIIESAQQATPACVSDYFSP